MTPSNPENPPAVPSPDQGPEQTPFSPKLIVSEATVSKLGERIAELERENAQLAFKHECACQTITGLQDERRQRQSWQILEALSSFLGMGTSDTLEGLDKRIREGIQHVVSVEVEHREQAERERDEARAELDNTRHRIIELQDEVKRLVDKCEYLRHEDIKAEHIIDSLRAQLAASEKDKARLIGLIKYAPHERHCGIYGEGTPERPMGKIRDCDCFKSKAVLRAQLAASEKDRERLDWLERIDHQKQLFGNWIGGGGTLRAAIDAAMKEAK